MKQMKEQNNLSENLLMLLTKIVEQNSILIDNTSSKQAYIIELLEALSDPSEEELEEDDVDSIYRTLD